MNSVAEQLFVRIQGTFSKVNVDVFEGVSLWLLKEKNLNQTLATLTHAGAAILEEAWEDLDRENWSEIIEKASTFMPKPKIDKRPSGYR